MHQSDLKINFTSGLTIFAKDIYIILFSLFSHIELTHVEITRGSCNRETAISCKFLVRLLCYVEDFTLKSNSDVLEIGWHLEVEDAVMRVTEFNLIEVLCVRHLICEVGRRQSYFHVFKEIKRSWAVVN
jgi:hypothetical protein